MIIRRRHTANFTTIGNELFEDERLAADELGILAFLRSKPHDWEVRRPALMRRFRVGRDTMKRVINNWMRTGWCQAIKTRLSNGTFHIIYEIRDEPGPELSPDEIRRALSLVSSEAADGDDEDGDDAGEHMPETGDPPPPEPGVADQGVASRHWPIEDSLKTESLRTDSTQAVRVFADVKAIWPPEHVLSLAACEGLHASLPDGTKEAAFTGIKPYLGDCAAQGRKVCDLSTYYRERRWERFAAVTPATGKPFALRPGIPQAYRWREYYERAEPEKLKLLDRWLQDRGVYTVPSEWPPALPPKQEPTGPPSHLTDEDIQDFTK